MQTGEEVAASLLEQGIVVKAPNAAAIAEESPVVYKPSSEVVGCVSNAGLSRIICRMKPLGVIKG